MARSRGEVCGWAPGWTQGGKICVFHVDAH